MRNVEDLEQLPEALQTQLSLEVNHELLEIGMFQGLSLEVRLAVIHTVAKRIYVPHDIIIRDGDNAENFFVLQRGEIRVEKHGKQLGIMTNGAFFGEVALFEKGAKRTASCIAITFCDVLTISHDDFDQACSEYSELRAAMQRYITSPVARKAAKSQKSLRMSRTLRKARSFAAKAKGAAAQMLHKSPPAMTRGSWRIRASGSFNATKVRPARERRASSTEAGAPATDTKQRGSDNVVVVDLGDGDV